MESSNLLVPFTGTSFIRLSHRGVVANLLSFSSGRAALKLLHSLPNHTRWLTHSNSCITQPFKHLSMSLEVYAFTLEGDAIVDNGAATAWKSENDKGNDMAGKDSRNGNASHTADEESKNGMSLQSSGEGKVREPTIDGPWRRSYAPRKAGRYADRVEEKIKVPLDALKPGVVLPGKITNIVHFGVFVDVGAFTSGLIHVSRLPNHSANATDKLKVGEEVQVKVISMDPNQRRLRLSLARDDAKLGVEESHYAVDTWKAGGKNPSVVSSKRISLNEPGRPQKGEVITGSITRILRSGVLVMLNEGHKGFLPSNEVLSNGDSVDTESFFRMGQQIPVRVKRTTRDKIILTMRRQERTDHDSEVDRREMVTCPQEEGRATSPFEIAFRRIKVIADFLEERERLQNLSNGDGDEDAVRESA